MDKIELDYRLKAKLRNYYLNLSAHSDSLYSDVGYFAEKYYVDSDPLRYPRQIVA